jgi:hypothetical protein
MADPHRLSLSDLVPLIARPVSELRALAPGFFVQISPTQAPVGPMRTVDAWTPAHTLELVTWILPVMRRASSDLAFVSIGRLDGNDVVISDVTISKFHAFVRDVAGQQLLQDAGSHNGTFVNNVRIAARKAGDPVPLRNGDAVRFGSVKTNYLDADGMHAFLQRMGPEIRESGSTSQR